MVLLQLHSHSQNAGASGLPLHFRATTPFFSAFLAASSARFASLAAAGQAGSAVRSAERGRFQHQAAAPEPALSARRPHPARLVRLLAARPPSLSSSCKTGSPLPPLGAFITALLLLLGLNSSFGATAAHRGRFSGPGSATPATRSGSRRRSESARHPRPHHQKHIRSPSGHRQATTPLTFAELGCCRMGLGLRSYGFV